MHKKIRVLVVDDHPLFRQGVVHSLACDPYLYVIGEASSGEAALKLAVELLPDVVLLDISMPGWNGLVTAQKINDACPAITIVMLTVSEDKDMLFAALKAGARAYVLKGASASELTQVVRTAANGEMYVPPSLTSDMLVSLNRNQADDPLQKLTEREREILQLIGTGMTNREIGAQIFLAEKTIKHYVTNILQKLQVCSRMKAVFLASQHEDFNIRSNNVERQ